MSHHGNVTCSVAQQNPHGGFLRQRQLAVAPKALTQLQGQNYPGNVRELRNLLERASLLCDGDTIEASHVQQALQSGRRPGAPYGVAKLAGIEGVRMGNMPQHAKQPGSADKSGHTLHALEQQALRQALANHTGSRAELAAGLGISQRSLYRKIKALGDPLNA